MADVHGHQAVYGGDEGLRHHLCVAHGEHMDEGASREDMEERHEGEHEYSPAHRGEYSCPDGEHDEYHEPTELTDMHDRDAIGEIHRGIGVALPDELHRLVHDPARPPHERARALLEHVSDHPEGNGHLGTHWTTENGVAENFAETAAKWKRDEDDKARPAGDLSFGHYDEENEDDEQPRRYRLPRPGTAVVFHAHPPSAGAIDRNPHRPGNGDVYGWSEHGEREVPVASSHDLSLRGISWAQVHAEADPDESHWWPEYEHHDFDGHEPREAAARDDSAMHLPDGSALVEGMDCPTCGHHITRYRDYWWNDDNSPHDCDDFRHEQHTAAARPGRGEKKCPCCADGAHSDGTLCTACGGTGSVGRSERPERCPGQPGPKRRHWRQTAAVAGSREEYGYQHRSLDSDPPFHEAPSRIRQDPYHYAHGEDAETEEAVRQFRGAQGNPGHPVRIYRTAPRKSGGMINTGDWVTTAHGYARDMADGRNEHDPESLLTDPLGPDDRFHVYEATVPARHLRCAGDLMEQGYWGDPLQGEHSARCGQDEGEHTAGFKDRADAGDDPSGDYKDALLGHFEAADYSMQHTAPNPAAGHLPLHHYTGEGPDEPVRVYRAAPAGTGSINTGDWVSLNPGYAHQHGYEAGPGRSDWPVYTAEVPQRHVHWDENDENEHGYNGPAIHRPDVHDEETGAHHDWEDWHDAHPHGQEAWAGGAVHLTQQEHDFVHDPDEWEPDRADTVLNAAREQGSLRRSGWQDDLYPAREDAEGHASAITPPEGRRLTAFTVHRGDDGKVADVAVHPYRHDDDDLRRYRNMDMEEHYYEHPAVGEVGKGAPRQAAYEAPPREYSAGRMLVSDILVPGEGHLSERPYTQDELAGDIRRNGVQQPIAVEHLPAHGGPTSFNGMHRLDAARRAGVPDVPVIVKHLPGQPPLMTERRQSGEQEFNDAFNLERAGRWAGQHEAALARSIEFRPEGRGSHGGYTSVGGGYVPRETYGTWHAHDAATGEHLGRLDYGIAEGHPGDRVLVQHMVTDEGHQGEGVASALMDHLYGHHPEPAVIAHSMRTDEGASWWEHYIATRPHITERDERQAAEPEPVPGGPWYHGSEEEHAPGGHVRPDPDDGHALVNTDPYQAQANGHHVYEVTPHGRPAGTDDIQGSYGVPSATVVRRLSDDEVDAANPYRDYGRHEAALDVTAGPEDYGVSHRPCDDLDQFHDLGNHTFPQDVYEHPEYFGGSPDYGTEHVRQMRAARGKPDHPVRIYRAMHQDAPREINPGDWVATSRRYADFHAETQGYPDGDWHVVSATVPAHHVRSGAGSDLHEWGYWGPRVEADEGQAPRTAAAGPAIQVGHEERPSGGSTYPHMHVLTATHPDGTTAELRYMLSKRNGKGVVDHAFIPGGYAGSLGKSLVQEARRLHPSTFIKALPGIDEDWGQHLPSVASLHRNLTVKLEPADRSYVHDESVPRAHRAKFLMDLMERSGPSMHWASQRGRAAAEQNFGDHEFRSPEHTQVSLSAAPPSPEHVETDPERISRNGGYAYQPPDWEVPVREGAPVTVNSVRWRTGGSAWTRHQFRGGHQFTAGRHGVTWEDLGRHLEDWFHPQQLDASRYPHPKTGYGIQTGLEHRTARPPEGQDEGPAEFRVTDYGPPGAGMMHQFRNPQPNKPIEHVYRGVSSDEWRQARERGYLKSDQRGTIADWEGTNAATDPRTAVSYLPLTGTGHVLKIRVHPDEKWFTIPHDQYLRTRERIPLDRVEGVSPEIEKGSSGAVTRIGSPKEAAMHEPGIPNPHTGSHDWFHGTQGLPENFSQHGFEHDRGYDHEEAEVSDHLPHWNSFVGPHFAAAHDVAEKFARSGASGERHDDDYSDAFDDPWREQVPMSVVHARLQMRNPKHYASEHDMDHEAYEHEYHDRKNYIANHFREGYEDEEPSQDNEDGSYYDEPHGDEEWALASRFRHDDVKPIPRDAWSSGSLMDRNPGHPVRTEWLNSHPDKAAIARRFRERLEAQGHDGIIYGNEFEHSEEPGRYANKSAVPFRPRQVEIDQMHAEHKPCLPPGDAREQRSRMPGPGQEELPFREAAFEVVAHFEEPRTATPVYMQQKLFHMQPEPSNYHPESGHRTPSDPAWRRHNDLENYEPDECEHCGGDRNFPEDHADTHHNWLNSQDWYTDWNEEHLPDTIHRGIGLDLPDHVHSVVHDESRPVHERAHALLSHVLGDANAGGSGLGNFWSSDSGVSKTYAESAAQRYGRQNQQTPVMIHARTPALEHIETDPDQLRHWGVYSYRLAGNREVPLAHGAPVRVSGISWAPPGHSKDAGTRDKPPRLADDDAWAHHEVGGEGIRATASGALGSGEAADQLREIELVAHFGGGAALPFAREGDDGNFDHPEYGYEDDEGWRHPQHGWHCHSCGKFHDDPEEVSAHETAHTDWDREYPRLPAEMHRGLRIDGGAYGPTHLGREGQGTHEAAQEILHHIGAIGTHWTPNPDQARHYSVVGNGSFGDGTDWNVVIHARKPEREHIETDPDTLAEQNVYGMDYHDDAEIPLREHAPVHVTGVSWKRDSDPDSAWQRHDLAEPAEHTAALEDAGTAPCRYCGEPLDDEAVREGRSAHEECSDMRWCGACQEHHDDPDEAEDHNSTYTDWGGVLPFEHGIHRGITVKLPQEVHAAVHDESRPPAERAAILGRHLSEDGLGVHWTDNEPLARAWGSGDGALFGIPDEERSHPSWTHVVMHAASPGDDHIEADPSVLSRRNMVGFDHEMSEREVPLREGAPVTLTGLSWKRAGHPDWQRHDIAPVTAHTAALEDGAVAHLEDDDELDEDYSDVPGSEFHCGDEVPHSPHGRCPGTTLDDFAASDEGFCGNEEAHDPHGDCLGLNEKMPDHRALPYMEPPREGELRDHMHHMHGLDSQTSDLHMSPKNQARWHHHEHQGRDWTYAPSNQVPHQHDEPRGIEGEAQWPDVFQLSEHTDFAGGTPRRNGEFERVLHDPEASRPFQPLRPSESSLHLPVVAHFEEKASMSLVHGRAASPEVAAMHLILHHGREAAGMPADPVAAHDASHREDDWLGHLASDQMDGRGIISHPGDPASDDGSDYSVSGDASRRRPRQEGEPVDPVLGSAKPVTASWDNSGTEHSGVYLRFGHWPADERSFSPAGGYHEEGVSAYDLDRHGNPAIDHGLDRGHTEHNDDCDVDEFGTCQYSGQYDGHDSPDNDPIEEMQGRVRKAEKNRYRGDDRPGETGHLVRGELSGVGYDGEPLLQHVRRVGDWIDHRHLLIPGAQPHRLARDPSDEDYEPPEEAPAGHTAAREVTAYNWKEDEGPYTWDEIAARHPRTYGDDEDHEPGMGGGHDIADAAAELYHDRPGHPYSEDTGELHPSSGYPGSEIEFHPRTVDPRRIDYIHAEDGAADPRVRRAREGFRGPQPGEHVPPLILVHRHGVYQVADGHHRAAGADLEHRPVRAYVAYSPHEDEPFASRYGKPPARGPFHGAETEDRPPLKDQNGKPFRISYPGFPHAAEAGQPHTAALDLGREPVVAHFDDEQAGRGGPEGEREPEWHASWGVRPDAECPECNTRADAGRGAEQLHFNIGGQDHPSYLARCQNCESVYDSFKSGRQARIDREFGQQAWKAHTEKRDLQEQQFSHVTPNKTHPLTYWGDESILPQQADQAERQNLGPSGIRYRMDTEQGRKIYEHRVRRVLRPENNAPLDPSRIEMRPGWMPVIPGPKAPAPGKDDYRITQMHRESARLVEGAREDAYDEDEHDGPDSSGDGYTSCGQGHEHWGTNGAAGLLVRHQGDDGRVRYLLQHRSPHVQHGGTWSTPGGAIRDGETPEHAAHREATEELGELPGDLVHHHTFTDDHGGWAYHTVVVDSPHQFHPEGGDEDWEHAGHGWFAPAEMDGLDLHPGFRSSWGTVQHSGALRPVGPSAREERGDRWHEFSNRHSDDLHRGIITYLPDELHDYVHDESVPREDRAHALQEHFSGAGLGLHWTDNTSYARRAIQNAASGDESGHGAWHYHNAPWGSNAYTDDDYEEEESNPGKRTEVMFHARRPGERNRLRNPQQLDDYGIYQGVENEFPLKPGSPVRLSGISWRQHDPRYPSEAFEHADFPKPVRHVSSVQAPVAPRALSPGLVIASSVSDTVAARPTPLPGIADALAAVASWKPATAAEAREGLEDFPGLFSALQAGLEALAGHLDEAPVSDGIPQIIRSMATACLSATEDARQVASMPLGDPAEGTCTPPKA